jgi:hypothetical protein
MGHQVLLSPEWIEGVSWLESIVTIDLDRETIKSAPAYDPDASLEREAEGTIYGHYGRQRYWDTPQDRAGEYGAAQTVDTRDVELAHDDV